MGKSNTYACWTAAIIYTYKYTAAANLYPNDDSLADAFLRWTRGAP